MMDIVIILGAFILGSFLGFLFGIMLYGIADDKFYD